MIFPFSASREKAVPHQRLSLAINAGSLHSGTMQPGERGTLPGRGLGVTTIELSDVAPIFAERASHTPVPAPLSSTARNSHTYAALDLGTNNCRLLVARPHHDRTRNGADGLRIVDAFSRIVRLGEGLHQTGELGAAAVARTLDALAVCRAKMEQRGVTRARLIATEACRMAADGEEFLARVRDTLGLDLEVIDRETEARLAALGCAALANSDAEGVLIFDIGGGSSELIWLDPRARMRQAASGSIFGCGPHCRSASCRSPSNLAGWTCQRRHMTRWCRTSRIRSMLERPAP